MMILWGNCLLVAEALLSLTLITLILNKPPKVAHRVELILADKHSGGYLYFIISLIGQRPFLVQWGWRQTLGATPTSLACGIASGMGTLIRCNPNRALTNPVVCSWTFCISALCYMFCMSVLCIYTLHLLCTLFVLKLLCKRVLTNPVGRSAVLTNPVAGRGHMEPGDMASSTKQTIVSRHRITNMAMNWTRYVLIQTWFFSALFFSFPLTQT